MVLTGAGISTDSGIPDFRGPNGVWTEEPEGREAGPRCSTTWPTPRSAAGSWQHRLEHPALAGRAERRAPGPRRASSGGASSHTLITQNVDGLHQAAGTDPGRVVEVHGTIHEVVCMSCDERAPMERALARVRAGEADPPCRTCGGILKSATISFGQNLVAERPPAGPTAARALRPAAGRRLDAGGVPGGRRRAHGLASRRPASSIVNGEPDRDGRPRRRRAPRPISEVLPRLVRPLDG